MACAISQPIRLHLSWDSPVMEEIILENPPKRDELDLLILKLKESMDLEREHPNQHTTVQTR